MKRKGFTLIELLAVIVILAIIALIGTPIILGVIEKAEKGAAKSSALGYLSAVETQVAINAIDTSKEDIVDGNYEVSELSSKGVQVKGNGPTGGNVTITKGQVSACSLEIGKYTITCLENGEVRIDEKIGEELEVTEISDITQSLLDDNTTSENYYTYMEGTYLKGVQESNYVWYNGFLWRIMGINKNGTVRLITEENVTAIAYDGTVDQGLSYDNKVGYINDWLNNYFLNNLDISKTDIIEESDWCLNLTTVGTSVRENCDGGSTFKADVGLMTLDEYNLSGASNINNTYYLFNDQIFWTLTPQSTTKTWIVSNNGATTAYAMAYTAGVRPVINVSSDALITGGNGTLNDAYILNQTIEEKSGKLNENSSSGEYVSLDGKIYRIVSKETTGTKLIYDGYYEETNKYGSNSSFTLSSGIGQKLNGDILTWLGNSEKIIYSNWYQASDVKIGTQYTTILKEDTTPINAKVGLIRTAEMLSGQSASILTKNYEVRSSVLNTSDYWTMNKSTDTAWYVKRYGSNDKQSVSNSESVRPVIVVSTDAVITSGNGTLQKPYIIE